MLFSPLPFDIRLGRRPRGYLALNLLLLWSNLTNAEAAHPAFGQVFLLDRAAVGADLRREFWGDFEE